MAVGGSVKSDLVELSSFPIVVEVPEPSMHFQIMKSDVGNDFLLEGSGVSRRGDSVFESEGLELCVSIQAVFDGLWDLISKTFDETNQLHQISDWALSSLLQYLPSKHNNFVGSVIIDAGHNSSGIRELILLE